MLLAMKKLLSNLKFQPRKRAGGKSSLSSGGRSRRWKPHFDVERVRSLHIIHSLNKSSWRRQIKVPRWCSSLVFFLETNKLEIHKTFLPSPTRDELFLLARWRKKWENKLWAGKKTWAKRVGKAMKKNEKCSFARSSWNYLFFLLTLRLRQLDGFGEEKKQFQVGKWRDLWGFLEPKVLLRSGFSILNSFLSAQWNLRNFWLRPILAVQQAETRRGAKATSINSSFTCLAPVCSLARRIILLEDCSKGLKTRAAGKKARPEERTRLASAIIITIWRDYHS